MRKLTEIEIIAHKAKIKQCREKAAKAKIKFCDGDITVKKMYRVIKESQQEEAEYIRKSGVILYFGKLFMAEA